MTDKERQIQVLSQYAMEFLDEEHINYKNTPEERLDSIANVLSAVYNLGLTDGMKYMKSKVSGLMEGIDHNTKNIYVR